VWSDLLPPCNHACPAGENIQAWLALAQAGDYRKAWETLVATIPCQRRMAGSAYHPCETGCNRGEMDAPVSIHAVERFLGRPSDGRGVGLSAAAPSSGKRVLVVRCRAVGAVGGYHLTRLGHQVEIHEAGPVPGGMLQFGIPAYRLPRAELAAEVGSYRTVWLRIVLDHPVTDVLAEQTAGGFDAVFVAIGAHVAQHANIPARDAARVLDAVSMLRDVGTGGKPTLGRRVVIYAAATPRWTPPARLAGWVPRKH